MDTRPDALGDPISLEQIRHLQLSARNILDRLRERVFAPDSVKELTIRFGVEKAAEMVGRSSQAIRAAESDGRLPAPPTDDKGRRSGYSLAQVNHMRDVFGTRPGRAPTDEPVILAAQNFKGGVAKSTIVCHLAQNLALKGYRICVIDCDSQASTTTWFGFNPDLDVSEDDTLYPYLMHGGEPTLQYAVRETYWDGISLIPANLSLYNAEYAFAAKLRGDALMLERLRHGVATISDQFDVVLMDPPPALGMISLSVLSAANALVIPVPPAQVDFASTVTFLTMLVDVLETLEQHQMVREFKFARVLASKVNENKSTHAVILRMMRDLFGTQMLEAGMVDSAEIDNAAAQLQTVYELEGPITSRQTHNRCRAFLDAVCGELELLIRKTWPSHSATLRQEGRL